MGIVLDSSFIIAYHNRSDVHHEAAREVMAGFLDGTWGDGLLLEYVFLEVVTVLQLRLGHEAAVSVGSLLLEARELSLVPCSELFLPALRVFREQNDHGLSFVDSAIVAEARRHGSGHVATFDRGFAAIDGVSVVSTHP
jgi:predicted nucleic acid-binding protein